MSEDQAFIIAILAIAVPSILSLLTLLIIQVFQWNRLVEQRRWEIADRKESLRLSHQTHAAVLDVGHKADAAYMEANNANIKIQSLQDELTTALNLPHKSITKTENLE